MTELEKRWFNALTTDRMDIRSERESTGQLNSLCILIMFNISMCMTPL